MSVLVMLLVIRTCLQLIPSIASTSMSLFISVTLLNDRRRGELHRSATARPPEAPRLASLVLSDENHDAAALSKLRSASRQRVKFAMSERLPSGRLIRYIPGHFGSGTMRGSSLAGLRFSVTLCGFCPPDIPTGAVTLRTAPAATPGRVAAILIGVARLRVRCAATRQRGPQKRAVERCGLNGEPQARQVALMTPPRRRPSGPQAISGVTQPSSHRSCGQVAVPVRVSGRPVARIGESPCRSREHPREDHQGAQYSTLPHSPSGERPEMLS